jgi:drug/metabolite transporter (DMT)-like permease
MTKKTFIALCLALLACFFWAGNFIVARGVQEIVPPFSLAMLRWVVAFIFILPIGFKHIIAQRKAILGSWKYMLFMGVFGVGVFNTTIYLAAHHTNTHHLSLITSTAPIWTLLMAGILRIENLSMNKILGAILAFIGALVIITEGHLTQIMTVSFNKGDLIVLFGSLMWALYCVMLYYKPVQITTRAFLTVIIFIGAIALMPFSFYEIAMGGYIPLDLNAIGVYLYIGVGASVVSWFAWNHAIHTIGSVKTSLVYYTIPIISAVMAIYFLDEALEAYIIYGFILVCMGIIVSNVRKLGFVKK